MSQPKVGNFESLSKLLAYPSEDVKEQAEECHKKFMAIDTPAASAVNEFKDFTQSSTVSDMQELYTRTFEINPLCALEVGWQLFGERYERGTFIVKMRQTLRDLKLPESTELPDHLVHVLQALDKLQPEEAGEFANLFIVPAVDKMIDGFKDKENIYRNILSGIVSEVRERYNLPKQGASND